MISDETVKALWLELRIAGQYPKTWQRIENLPFDPRTGKERKVVTSPSSAEGSSQSLPPPGSAAWLEMIEPPSWFVREELGFGFGCGPNIVATAKTNARDNKRRREDAEKYLADLARSYTVRISRKVTS